MPGSSSNNRKGTLTESQEPSDEFVWFVSDDGDLVQDCSTTNFKHARNAALRRGGRIKIKCWGERQNMNEIVQADWEMYTADLGFERHGASRHEIQERLSRLDDRLQRSEGIVKSLIAAGALQFPRLKPIILGCIKQDILTCKRRVTSSMIEDWKVLDSLIPDPTDLMPESSTAQRDD